MYHTKESLQRALEQAVAREEYEEAARLRDLLAQLESASNPNSPLEKRWMEMQAGIPALKDRPFTGEGFERPFDQGYTPHLYRRPSDAADAVGAGDAVYRAMREASDQMMRDAKRQLNDELERTLLQRLEAMGVRPYNAMDAIRRHGYIIKDHRGLTDHYYYGDRLLAVVDYNHVPAKVIVPDDPQ